MSYTTIDDPSAYFQTKIYSGSSSAQALTFDGNSDMQPDWLWLKRRSAGGNHFAYDSVRGANRSLVPNDTDAEDTSGESTSYLTSFDSDGFTVAGGYNNTNNSGSTYVGWGWKESTTAGFDIVTYTGNQTARTISHNLGAVPKMMIVKTRSTTGNWGVYHIGLGTANKRLEMDNSSASDTGTSVWNDTDPTSSVFSVGNNDRITNGNGMTYVAYLFADIQGYSKFGSYTANSNSSNFIYTGMKPAFLMVKQTESGGNENWGMFDNKRPGYNSKNGFLYANTSGAEDTSNATSIDLLSNGFCLRANTVGSNPGKDYIFMAFASNPFTTSSGVPATAR